MLLFAFQGFLQFVYCYSLLLSWRLLLYLPKKISYEFHCEIDIKCMVKYFKFVTIFCLLLFINICLIVDDCGFFKCTCSKK